MRLDGTYAKLVKIQSQIARNKQFEAALESQLEDFDEPAEDEADETNEADFAPVWLGPDSVEIRESPLGTLEVRMPDGAVHRSAFAVRCFPASRPDDFISLRAWDREGHEHELGIVRDLDRWPEGQQALLRKALFRATTSAGSHGSTTSSSSSGT